ncbi:MAG: S8 family peptidase [Lachnospiraceae bacterium]|nr:S8 family peptidase [Lachnospiraceae bacterium]
MLENTNLYPQIINNGFVQIFWNRKTPLDDYFQETLYSVLPNVYTLEDTTSVAKSGVIQVQSNPALGLTGRNILMGFLDTGIDYTHPAFQDSFGNTRIETIWDQTIQTGTPPKNLYYGSEYTKEQIQEALDSPDPYQIVPSRDTDGHGTSLAGVAAGSIDEKSDFQGVAPQAQLAVVKLKEAKPHLLDYYQFNGDSPMFQENDILMAIRFLIETANKLSMPLVICICLGTNQGSHTGDGALPSTLERLKAYQGITVVVAGGNEAGRAHHYSGKIPGPNSFQEVEIQVPANSPGFSMDFWGHPPELYTVGVVSPLGEVVERIPARFYQDQEISFILENTTLFISYGLVEVESGGQVIFFRFRQPTEGIWRIRVYCSNYATGMFHIWLPANGMVNPDITFLNPDPFTTIISPGNVMPIVTTAAYQAPSDALYNYSSRGFTPLNTVKPDITAPGVDLTVPRPGGGYGTATGSSIAGAFTAGCAALIAQWGLTRTPDRYFSSNEIKAFLIRGAVRNPTLTYPNREWGYGIINIYQVFTVFLSP